MSDESTANPLTAAERVENAFEDIERVLVDAHLYLRQGFEILNFTRTSRETARKIQFVLNSSWNALFLGSALRIHDLFDDDPKVCSLRSLVGLIAHEANALADDLPHTTRKELRSKAHNSMEDLKAIRERDVFKAIARYRTKAGGHTDKKGLGDDVAGKGFSTAQARSLIETANDFLNDWRVTLGKPPVINGPSPYGLDDTGTFFRLLELGNSRMGPAPTHRGWRFGEQHWRGKFM